MKIYRDWVQNKPVNLKEKFSKLVRHTQSKMGISCFSNSTQVKQANDYKINHIHNIKNLIIHLSLTYYL